MQLGDFIDTWLYLHKTSDICGMCLTNVLNPETQVDTHLFTNHFQNQFLIVLKLGIAPHSAKYGSVNQMKHS